MWYGMVCKAQIVLTIGTSSSRAYSWWRRLVKVSMNMVSSITSPLHGQFYLKERAAPKLNLVRAIDRLGCQRISETGINVTTDIPRPNLQIPTSITIAVELDRQLCEHDIRFEPISPVGLLCQSWYVDQRRLSCSKGPYWQCTRSLWVSGLLFSHRLRQNVGSLV